MRAGAGSQAILVCYDITNYQSFQNAEDWVRSLLPGTMLERSRLASALTVERHAFCGQVQLVRKVFPNPDQMPYMALVGNKVSNRQKATVKVPHIFRPFAPSCFRDVARSHVP